MRLISLYVPTAEISCFFLIEDRSPCLMFSEALRDSWRKACDDTDPWVVIMKSYVAVFDEPAEDYSRAAICFWRTIFVYTWCLLTNSRRGCISQSHKVSKPCWLLQTLVECKFSTLQTPTRVDMHVAQRGCGGGTRISDLGACTHEALESTQMSISRSLVREVRTQ